MTLANLPARVLHGPAAAVRLRAEGVDDEPFLLAVAFHTIGTSATRYIGASRLCGRLSGAGPEGTHGVAGNTQNEDVG